MGGFYIRWEKGLCTKPEISQIARTLKISKPEAAARCMMIWEWADEQTETGKIDRVSREDIDDVAGVKGISVAMENTVPIPWLLIDSNGVTFTRFDRHNGKSAKKRIAAAERKRRQRHASSVT